MPRELLKNHPFHPRSLLRAQLSGVDRQGEMYDTTLGKFTPMCLCSPSSIIWYLGRAFMLTRLYVAAMHWSNEQGEYCRSGSAVISRLLRTAI